MKLATVLCNNPIICKVYDSITQQSFWRQAINRMIDLAGPIPDGSQILDLGTGPGISAFALASRIQTPTQIVGVDISAEMIQRARMNHDKQCRHLAHLRFEVANATCLPFPDNSFSHIFAHSFLYLVDDASKVAKEARRVLQPGGRLVFMEPNDAGSWLAASAQVLPQFETWILRPGEAATFGLSMTMWRLFSRQAGRMSESYARNIFGNAGFETIDCRPTLGTLGLHIIAQ